MEEITVHNNILSLVARIFNLHTFTFNYGGDNNKLMSAMQKSYWFCIDKYYYPKLSFRYFSTQMVRFLPNLKRLRQVGIFGKTIKDFLNYNRSRPTSGAIIISKETNSVLMVQAYRSKLWSFPKGKLEEEDETYANIDPMVVCACREVYEETSINITKLIHPKDYCEWLEPYPQRLYWIEILSVEKIDLYCKTLGEIGKIEWIKIEELMSMANDPQFIIVAPVLKYICDRIS